MWEEVRLILVLGSGLRKRQVIMNFMIPGLPLYVPLWNKQADKNTSGVMILKLFSLNHFTTYIIAENNARRIFNVLIIIYDTNENGID